MRLNEILQLGKTFFNLRSASYSCGAPVQIADGIEMSSINMDALFIEHDGIPDVERSGILELESTKVELTIANSMH
jgi:hypothetical protein